MTELKKIEELSKTQPSIEELLKYLDINAKDLSGEIALWQSVIMQAVLDATSESKDIKSKIERAKTIAWFSLNNKDFMLVCSLSELNPHFVISGLKKVLKKNKRSYINYSAKKHKILRRKEAVQTKSVQMKKLQTA
jgi:hypothetical protein